jgi:phage baseplate assembly protein W
MSSVAAVPHELVRSFREMMCAINGLPESLFKGFTNPTLFEGESNCGASLGIAPAAVASFDNSFAATAQIAPERQISQVFVAPQSTVVIKEEPDQVVGVFLATDSDRSGDNYLESFSGREILLTSTPTVPIVVDYKVVQETTTNEIRLQATQATIINTEDTLERIAFNAYGDASRWKEIMLYNELEYPFIVPIGFVKEVKATGVVRFNRNPSYSPSILIPNGYKVYVPAFRGTLIIVYTVTSDTTLPLNQLFVDVPVECDHVGPIGNVGPAIIKGPYTDDSWATIWSASKSYLINQLIRPTTSNGFTFKCLIPGVSGSIEPSWPAIIGTAVNDGSVTWQCFRTDEFELTYYKITGISSISNTLSTNGGKIWAVLQPGDLIQIPGTTSGAASLVVGAKKTYDELFGIDLFINADGELEFGSEGNPDFRRVSGVDNLVQAIKNRVGTTLKFYVYHPDYGSNLPFYIGRKNDPFWDDLVRVDIRRVCLTDPRISDIESFFMTIDGDTIFISLDAIPINENSALPLNLVI